VFRKSRTKLARLPLYCFCGVRATHKCLAFLQFLREFWPMPLPLMIHFALALFAQRTQFPLLLGALAFVSFRFVLVRVRVLESCFDCPEAIRIINAKSPGKVGMRFLIAADIVYQLMSTTLAGRAGCAQIEQRAQSEELRKVPSE